MKSSLWYACLCAILMFVVSPAALANVYSVPDGGGGAWGGGSGSGSGASCSASAYANGTHPSSGAVYWASINTYTEEAGYFYISWDCTASASASYTDYNGSGASGSGGAFGGTYGGDANASMSLSSNNQVRSDADEDYDPGSSGMTEEAVWFDAFGGVGASSSCGANASIGNSPNTAHGHGDGYADVGLSG